jgi:predicted RNase H-like nuclease (RuvC/YqgF family)
LVIQEVAEWRFASGMQAKSFQTVNNSEVINGLEEHMAEKVTIKQLTERLNALERQLQELREAIIRRSGLPSATKQPRSQEAIARDMELSQRIYEEFKKRLRQLYPSLGSLPREQIVEEMEKLSQKIIKGMPFTSWQEVEAFMRGEEHYDFNRQQYLPH